MRVASVIIAVAVSAVLLPACGSDSSQNSGIIVGSIAGKSGSKARGSATPRTVIGGIAGNAIGRQLEATDRQRAASAEYRALEYGRSGTAIAWKSTKTPTSGAIVPGKPYKQGSVFCRTYTHTLHLGGPPETLHGTACRQADGTWHAA